MLLWNLLLMKKNKHIILYTFLAFCYNRNTKRMMLSFDRKVAYAWVFVFRAFASVFRGDKKQICCLI